MTAHTSARIAAMTAIAPTAIPAMAPTLSDAAFFCVEAGLEAVGVDVEPDVGTGQVAVLVAGVYFRPKYTSRSGSDQPEAGLVNVAPPVGLR